MIDAIVIILTLCALTLVLEFLPAALIIVNREYVRGVTVANLITNPILNMLLPFLYSLTGDVGGAVILILLEIGVVFMEAWIFGLFTSDEFPKRFVISLGLNAFSFAVGLIIQNLVI